MTDTPAAPRSRSLLGALAGLLAGAAGVAVSQAAAALLSGVSPPVYAVGNRAVDATPRPLKEWAISTFGSNDKTVLIGGMFATIAVVAMVAGALGVRRPRIALAVFGVLSVVAAVAVLTDRSSTAGPLVRLVPVLALVVVSVGALLLLLKTLRTPRGETRRSGSDLLPARVAGDDLPASFDRRAFLAVAVAVGAVATAGGLVGRQFAGAAAAAARAGLRLPRPASPAPKLASGVQLDVPGITPFMTSNANFYRVDTALQVPDVPLDGYTLRIHGMVDRELQLSFADLMKRQLVERRITLTCVSNEVGGNYLGNAAWLGIPVRELLKEAGVRAGADAVKSTSADDFTIGTPLQALNDPKRDALIAIGMNGQPLPLQHGFPVRMVVPGLYGYVSATKWLIDLEVTRFADFKAYWSTRGYSVEAPIKTSSRFDVPTSFASLKTGKNAVAGVAWSQDRGIKKVEVRVDGGAWREARLAEVDNIDTWRQWVYEWDAPPGSHRLEVRATDETGYTQTEKRVPIAPDGSTGWDSVNVTVS